MPLPEPGCDHPILLSADQLRQREAEIAAWLARDQRDEPPIYVVVLEGARVFAERLLARLPGQPRSYAIRASSYGAGTERGGEVEVGEEGPIPCEGRDVILIEDIVDTGLTAQRLIGHLLARGALTVRVVAMLSKPSRRQVQVPVAQVGFEIPDRFVIGYGMDLNGQYRDLPAVHSLNPPPSPSADAGRAAPTR